MPILIVQITPKYKTLHSFIMTIINLMFINKSTSTNRKRFNFPFRLFKT